MTTYNQKLFAYAAKAGKLPSDKPKKWGLYEAGTLVKEDAYPVLQAIKRDMIRNNGTKKSVLKIRRVFY